jgi:beta-galactosidase GanA
MFVLNHTARPQNVTLEKAYREQISGGTVSGTITLEPYGVRVFS